MGRPGVPQSSHCPGNDLAAENFDAEEAWAAAQPARIDRKKWS